MSLAGQGVVAIWNDVTPEVRAEFYEWHNREHMPERVGIPGFLRGRRYIAKSGAPEYFTLYEADSPEVLVGQDYLTRLNNPTPWTAKMVQKHFRNLARGICRVRLSLGESQGGYMVTLRFGPAEGSADKLDRYLRAEALPPLIDMPAMVGVHFCPADAAASGIQSNEKRGTKVDIPQWLVMLESVTPEGADAAADKLVGTLEKNGAAPGVDRALYALQNTRVKTAFTAG